MEIKAINKIPSMQTPVFHCSKGDVKRMIELELYDGTEENTITGSEAIRVRYRLPDGNISSFAVNVGYATSKIFVQVPGDVTAIAGHVYCKLRIDNIGYKAFFIEVEG